jgi:hypothetical protein
LFIVTHSRSCYIRILRGYTSYDFNGAERSVLKELAGFESTVRVLRQRMRVAALDY